MVSVLIVGILLFIAGITLVYGINRKRFNERNMFGKRPFRSYERAWMTLLGERFGKLIGWLLLLAGAFFLFLYWQEL